MRLPLALLLLAAAAIAQEPRDVTQRFLAQEREAFTHYRAKDYGRAIAAFERQIATYADNPRPYYNIACCYALEGDAGRAGTWLLISIQRGWRDARHLAGDPDFDAVRQSPEYLICLAKLKRARDADPDPMPLDLAPGAVPPAPSVSGAVAASQLQEQMVRRMEALYDVHRFRKELFQVLDRRMAVLGRYIVENGDAADAADAAVGRVGTAALYMAEAEGRGEPDRALREAGARAVLRTVEEFLRGYPGDPRLPNVLLARALALRALGQDADAIAQLRTVRADHPAAAPLAMAELCGLLPAGDELREVYAAAEARLGEDPRLARARLLCKGMPGLPALEGEAAARVAAHEGLLAYVCVVADDPGSEETLEDLPPASARFLPVVLCAGDASDDAAAWLAEHGRGLPAVADAREAIVRLGLGAPAVVLARKDGTVVAVNPDALELAQLAGQLATRARARPRGARPGARGRTP
ncbi:MAG TPA: hypothetical protein VFY93_08480, partial [Planctomycetota bacterium]|nr:hypothetical protein [Planctomycetota bacterium]